MAVDSNGLPIHFRVTGGEVHDCKEAPKWVAELPKAHYIVADRGYDSEVYLSRLKIKEQPLLSQEQRIQKSVMSIYIGVSVYIVILLRTFLQGLSISEPLLHDMIS